MSNALLGLGFIADDPITDVRDQSGYGRWSIGKRFVLDRWGVACLLHADGQEILSKVQP